jgi:hypothetical protein
MNRTGIRLDSLRKAALGCLAVIVVSLQIGTGAAYSAESVVGADVRNDPYSQEYTDLTKRIELAGIELERFSLNYRTASVHEPRFRRLRFFLMQEAGASGILVFEIVGDKEFAIGRNHPLKVSQRALHGALATAFTTSIIAGSGSCLELASNALLSTKNKKQGFDPHSANSYVFSHLAQVDALLREREALVLAHKDRADYPRALAEGKVLRDLRNTFVDEYAHFHSDARGYATFTNLFYGLNAITYSIGATAVGVAYRAVKTPKLNGPANILFVVDGALFMASPLLSTVLGTLVRKRSYRALLAQAKQDEGYDPAKLGADRKHLEELASNAKGTLMPSQPALVRTAIYGESEDRFRKQIDNETAITRHLEKVAVEGTVMGPVIGGALLTQGILGTTGYYKYTFRPRPQINRYFYGSVVGTVGGGLAVAGTGAWFIASTLYQERLRKEHRLPSQLINDRLAYIDELEKTITAEK